MWWTVLLVIVAAITILCIWSVKRSVKDRRRRVANWNDLHERGKLIALQLAQFREASIKKNGPGVPRPPVVPPAAMIDNLRLFWPGRVAPRVEARASA